MELSGKLVPLRFRCGGGRRTPGSWPICLTSWGIAAIEEVRKLMRLKLIAVSAMVAGGIAWAVAPGISSASVEQVQSHGIPRYNHIIEIMMENTSFSTIIGNSFAPNINALAQRYGLATDYFGVTHPSEPNY